MAYNLLKLELEKFEVQIDINRSTTWVRLVKTSIELSIKPVSSEIDNVGQRTCKLMKSCGVSDETVHGQIMLLRELIKTGKKYGGCPSSESEITVNVQLEKNTITLEVNKPINEEGFEELKEFDKAIQFFRGYQDPLEALTIKSKASFINSNRSHSNELDLFRIACKGNAVLDFFVSEDNILKISSTKKLEGNFCNTK